MYKIFVFSGTTEGRQLSEFLCEHEIFHEVFVATEYGQIVMTENEHAHVNTGRLDKVAMVELFEKEKPMMVLDATHPYAVEVTGNIRDALEKAGCMDSYIRVSREIPLSEKLLREDYPDIEVVPSTVAAIEYLKTTTGPILLTTGVKELHKYVSEPELKSRIYARILPGKESMSMAFELDLLPRQIIAMEGPFSTDINEALIKQFGIKVLVTKNSGVKGGFLEKLEACERTGAKAVVVDLVKSVERLSISEAEALVLERLKDKLEIETSAMDQMADLQATNVSVVGIGMGTSESITVAGQNAIKEAQVLIGAKRMIEFAAVINQTALAIEEYDKKKVNDLIYEHRGKRIVVVVSGDTGFYSLASCIKEANLFPGISSFSYLASKIAVPYSEATIKSFHGKSMEEANITFTEDKLFCIFSGKDDVKTVIEANPNYHVYIGFNLGQRDERIFETMDGLCPKLLDGLYTLCFEKR